MLQFNLNDSDQKSDASLDPFDDEGSPDSGNLQIKSLKQFQNKPSVSFRISNEKSQQNINDLLDVSNDDTPTPTFASPESNRWKRLNNLKISKTKSSVTPQTR